MHMETDSCIGGRKNEWSNGRRSVSDVQLAREVPTREIQYNPGDDNDGDIKVIKVLKVVDGCCSISYSPEGLPAKCQ